VKVARGTVLQTLIGILLVIPGSLENFQTACMHGGGNYFTAIRPFICVAVHLDDGR
jgi:hypothetical protein